MKVENLVSRILEHEKALFAENLIMIQMGVPNYNNFLLKNKATQKYINMQQKVLCS